MPSPKSYGKATGKTLDQVSKKFYGNTDFLGKLKHGKTTVTAKNLDKMVEKFMRCWPENAERPSLRALLIEHWKK